MDPRTPHQQPTAYQHWLDDAANMGLMLYRMRNDSKRERYVQPRATGPVPPPPPPVPPLTTGSAPIPMAVPPMERRHPHHHHRAPAPVAQEITPRTSRALQTPTVATHSSQGSGDSQPGSFYLQ